MSSAIDRQHLDPDIVRRLGRLDLVARMIVQGLSGGQHRSRRRGFSTEFSDFNPYAPGDDLRFLDWRLYARTDRLYIKRFEAETNLEVRLLLDASGSMAWRWQQRISKLEYAINLLAAIACLHLRQHDLVGLLVHDAKQLHHLPPRCRRSHLDAIYATLEGVVPGPAEAFASLVASLGERRRHRGRILLCSDLEEDEAQLRDALRRLAGHRDEVILLHLLDEAEVALPFAEVTHFRDCETGELLPVDLPHLRRQHDRQVAAFRETWRHLCVTAGITYLPITTAADYVDVIHALFDTLADQERR